MQHRLQNPQPSLKSKQTQHGSHLPQGDTLKSKLLLAVGITLSLSAFAQASSQTNDGVEHMNQTPTFRVTVISRSVQAINYEHRSGSSKLDFAGTSLMSCKGPRLSATSI
jgi:hypothetical protein